MLPPVCAKYILLYTTLWEMDLSHWIRWHMFDKFGRHQSFILFVDFFFVFLVTLLLPDDFRWVDRPHVKNWSLKCSIHSGKTNIYFFPWEFWLKHQRLKNVSGLTPSIFSFCLIIQSECHGCRNIISYLVVISGLILSVLTEWKKRENIQPILECLK